MPAGSFVEQVEEDGRRELANQAHRAIGGGWYIGQRY